MANKVLWDAAAASQGNVLTTELNALADGAFTASSSAFDNTSALIQYFMFRVAATFSSEPAAGAFVTLYALPSLDGSLYDYVESGDPGGQIAAIVPMAATTASQVKHSGIFTLPPSTVKFVLKNSTGQAFPASNSVVTLYSFSDEVQ